MRIAASTRFERRRKIQVDIVPRAMETARSIDRYAQFPLPLRSGRTPGEEGTSINALNAVAVDGDPLSDRITVIHWVNDHLKTFVYFNPN